jgi:hypothetical protein
VAVGLAVVAEDPASVGLERLGASDAFAGVLLFPLRASGWTVGEPVRAFAGGFMLIAERPEFGYEVRGVGETVAEAALCVFEQAAALGQAGGELQLQLFA